MMKDSLQKGPAYHFCPTMVNLFSLFISMFWLRTVDLHQVMVLIFPCWMFNFMLFILVLGTTALWLHYISKNIVGGALFAQKQSSKEKYNSVCTSKRPLSFTTIYSSGFFFFQLLTKKSHSAKVFRIIPLQFIILISSTMQKDGRTKTYSLKSHKNFFTFDWVVKRSNGNSVTIATLQRPLK